MATPVAIWSAVSASGYRHSTLVSSSVANPSVALSRALRESGTARASQVSKDSARLGYARRARAGAVNG